MADETPRNPPRKSRNRGKGTEHKRALKALTRNVPERHDIYRLILALAEGREAPESHERTIAIVCGAAIEHALRLAITKHLRKDISEGELNALFSDLASPLSTF